MGVMPHVHPFVYATPRGFRALGLPLLEGHTFDRPDPVHAPMQVVVTRALARRYWGNQPAVGKRLRLLAPTGPWFTVVGVTGDVRGSGLDQPPDETVYLPLVTAPGPTGPDGGPGAARWAPRRPACAVGGAAAPREVTSDVERVLRALAPTIPVYDCRHLHALLARSTARTAFTLALLELASLAALVLGAVGLYGMVAYMVSLRTRELAVRIALGAPQGTLQRQVVWQAVAMAGLGIVLGCGAALSLTRFLGALLFDVAPTDAATLLGAVLLMAAVAVAASWLPARRAAVIDIATALRPDA